MFKSPPPPPTPSPQPPPPPPPPPNRKKIIKNPVLSTGRVSKTDREGTLKRLLLHTTPRLKEPGKACRKSPSTITEPKAFPASFCIQACAQKASPTPPTPPSARLEIILRRGWSSYISGGAISCRSSRFKLNRRSHSLTCCSFADGILNNFFTFWMWWWWRRRWRWWWRWWRFQHLPT